MYNKIKTVYISYIKCKGGSFMKLKHLFWILSGIVAVVTMAAGIAVIIDRFMTRKECPDGYIDCGCDETTFEE